ncbi:MAG: protein serine/threonine phosphatase [Bacteroidetes bacterium]|jgi:serine phosphatase RsbU (regulator of sigma subunit)|nr:protein serine/threonine phosphatase [Bacteroidota bacterium]
MIKKTFLIFLLIAICLNITTAQTNFMDSVAHAEHGHSPIDILSGDGQDTIVCYKQAHRNVYLLVTALIVIIAVVAVKLLMLNKKTNKILKQKNEMIGEKNKNITDSINYAKRLQNAILPSNDVIDSILPEHFLLYQPKDIVSGDFYWVSGHGNKFVVAAIDCTGHGVPGALLSIVGHNAIAKTVNEMNITKPNDILISMNSIIKKILHQDANSDIRDGMDMALCTFDKATNTLEYSGANNPIYIITEGQMKVVKATKLTIGSIQEEVKYLPEHHSIPLKKGDCFYIFSDGYADQFGGADNKKFKTSRMQDLLLSINNKPMPEQKTLIHKAFADWKGNNEQVDDVLVIGIRV